jgi:hypothetical protein
MQKRLSLAHPLRRERAVGSSRQTGASGAGTADHDPKGTAVVMRRTLPCVALSVLLCLVACAAPPQAEIDAAKTALAMASGNADVITYAPDALRAAQERMTALEAELAAQAKKPSLSRSYDTATSMAVAVADLARAAGATAVTEKAEVAQEAAALVNDVTTTIPVFESKMWAAKRVARIKLDFTALQQIPGQARAAVADAQKDIAAGAYATAKAKLLAVKGLLTDNEETITEQTRIARQR